MLEILKVQHIQTGPAPRGSVAASQSGRASGSGAPSDADAPSDTQNALKAKHGAGLRPSVVQTSSKANPAEKSSWEGLAVRITEEKAKLRLAAAKTSQEKPARKLARRANLVTNKSRVVSSPVAATPVIGYIISFGSSGSSTNSRSHRHDASVPVCQHCKRKR